MIKKSSNTAISSSFSAQRLYCFCDIEAFQHINISMNVVADILILQCIFKKNDRVQHDLRIDRGVTCRGDVCFFSSYFWNVYIGKKIVSLGDFATKRQPSLSWYRSQTQTMSLRFYLTFQLMFKLFLKAWERLNMHVTFFH